MKDDGGREEAYELGGATPSIEPLFEEWPPVFEYADGETGERAAEYVRSDLFDAVVAGFRGRGDDDVRQAMEAITDVEASRGRNRRLAER